jgi:hypothetical protein
MATPQLSPGVLTREVDLTVGRADNVLDNIGAIAGPFSVGPVNQAITVTNEQQFINTFGKPLANDNQYEYWMSASSYLSYGGVLKVVRTDGDELKNANVGVGQSSTANLKIANYDDYNASHSSNAVNFYYAAKNPGTWANGLKLCFIDDLADQVIGIATTSLQGYGIQVGYGITVDIAGISIPDPSTGKTSVFDGYLKGIVTQISNSQDNLSAIAVKIVSRVSAAGTETIIDYSENSSYSSIKLGNRLIAVDNNGSITSPQNSIKTVGITSSTAINGAQSQVYTGLGATTSGSGSGAVFTITRNSTDGNVLSASVTTSGVGYTSGGTVSIAGTSVGGSDLFQGKIKNVSVTVSTAVTTASNATYSSIAGVSTVGTGASFTVYRNGSGGIGTVTVATPGSSYFVSQNITILGTNIGGLSPADDVTLSVSSLQNDKIVLSITSTKSTLEALTVNDWYNEQTLLLDNSTVYWSSIAPKPTTTAYSSQRGGSGDGMHIVLVDDYGTVSGIQGNILEKHIGLSKASDAVSAVNSPQKIWYKQYLADFSSYIYAGVNQSNALDNYHDTFASATTFLPGGFIKQPNSSMIWDAPAAGQNFTAIGGITYRFGSGSDYGINNGMEATLGSLSESYDLLSNRDELALDYLIMGPGLSTLSESQAKANKLISIADSRKDCIAVISPHREGIVNIADSATQTDNLIEYYSPLTSSSYAVFDSGYKYTYDRFSNVFRYIPCSGDIAGLMCAVNLNSYPWFSPAGQQRGGIKNAIKLAYNPSKAQRDIIYSSRINPIINQPGAGVILYGDKTALVYSSAFDRINVRRLFLTVEQALEKAAQAQLFEFNDQITRANFVNIVDPYLRDIQAKRGVFDYVVVCDETNNTPDVVDNNEFRADIFLKPNKSINYITLTFVATRTGVSFEEVAGRV